MYDSRRAQRCFDFECALHTPRAHLLLYTMVGACCARRAVNSQFDSLHCFTYGFGGMAPGAEFEAHPVFA